MITALAIRNALTGRVGAAKPQHPSVSAKLIEELAIFLHDAPLLGLPVPDGALNASCCNHGGIASTSAASDLDATENTVTDCNSDSQRSTSWVQDPEATPPEDFLSCPTASYEEPIQDVQSVGGDTTDTGSSFLSLDTDDSSSASERPSAVQFHPMANVREIPHHEDYPVDIQQALWMSIDEVAEMAERSKYEYLAEGCHPLLALEEEDFIKTQTGELLHPETWRRQQEKMQEAAPVPVPAPEPAPVQEIVCQTVDRSSNQPLQVINANETMRRSPSRPRTPVNGRNHEPPMTAPSPRSSSHEHGNKEKRRRRRRRVHPSSGEAGKSRGAGKPRGSKRGMKQFGDMTNRHHAPSLFRFADV